MKPAQGDYCHSSKEGERETFGENGFNSAYYDAIVGLGVGKTALQPTDITWRRGSDLKDYPDRCSELVREALKF